MIGKRPAVVERRRQLGHWEIDPVLGQSLGVRSGATSTAAGSPAQIEAASAVKFYFATPHHSWERGTNENTNGLIRQ